MIDASKLRSSIKPGTSESMINWIMFTNHHHNDKRSEKETIEKFRGNGLGEYLEFDKLDNPPEVNAAVKPVTLLIPENVSTRRKVTIKLDQEQAGELFGLLEKHKDEHPELHELVYQWMTRDLFLRLSEQ